MKIPIASESLQLLCQSGKEEKEGGDDQGSGTNFIVNNWQNTPTTQPIIIPIFPIRDFIPTFIFIESACKKLLQPPMKYFAILLLYLTIPVTKPLAQEDPDDNQFVEWIVRNAREIKTVSPNEDFDDLLHLKTVLRDVKLVGLGESTHGTSEFFKMKHRLLRFLVQEMNYTRFYLEASMSRCRYINDYVLYGKGNADSATLIQGFVPWRVEEVRDMIEWIRTYNKSVAENKKVRFYGIDLQINDMAWKQLKEFYKIVKEKKVAELDNLQQKADSAAKQSNNPDSLVKGAVLFGAIHKDIMGIVDDMVMNQGEYEYKVGKENYQRNLMNIKLIAQQAESYKNLMVNFRDYYMAQNVLHLQNQGGDDTKGVVWAHNGHISKGWTTMGSFLAEIMGKKYYAIGFDFFSGSFQSRNKDINNTSHNWDIIPLGAPPAKSLPWYLNKAGHENFFIDFRFTGIENLKAFSKSYPMHSVGSMYSASWPQVYPEKLTDYDGLIFIRNSTPAKNFSRKGMKPF